MAVAGNNAGQEVTTYLSGKAKYFLMSEFCLIRGIQAPLVPDIKDKTVLCKTVTLAIGVFDFMTSTFPSYTDEASNRWVCLELLLTQHCPELQDNVLIGHSSN